jgi:hypothetical protein
VWWDAFGEGEEDDWRRLEGWCERLNQLFAFFALLCFLLTERVVQGRTGVRTELVLEIELDFNQIDAYTPAKMCRDRKMQGVCIDFLKSELLLLLLCLF